MAAIGPFGPKGVDNPGPGLYLPEREHDAGPLRTGAAVRRGRRRGRALWLALVLLGVLLVVLNPSYGMFTVILTGVLVYVVGRYTPLGAQIVGAYAIAWLLLLSAVRRVPEIGVLSDDGANLSGLTHLPRLVWFLLWLAATLAAVAVGGTLLVMPA